MGRITETVKVLIIINVLFFAGSYFIGDTAFKLFAMYPYDNPNFEFWQPVTSMFMHGGLMHILFNMYALFAFGSPLEAQWGRNKFLFFYFSAGIGASFIHLLVTHFQFQQGYDVLVNSGLNETQIIQFFDNPENRIYEIYHLYHTPAVGASGAIYGVLVAFGLMYPNAELMLLFLPVPIKAKFFIPGIILIDLFSGLTGFSLFGQNIANWAHIGGALFGFIMAWYWKKNSFDNTRWY